MTSLLRTTGQDYQLYERGAARGQCKRELGAMHLQLARCLHRCAAPVPIAQLPTPSPARQLQQSEDKGVEQYMSEEWGTEAAAMPRKMYPKVGILHLPEEIFHRLSVGE